MEQEEDTPNFVQSRWNLLTLTLDRLTSKDYNGET